MLNLPQFIAWSESARVHPKRVIAMIYGGGGGGDGRMRI